ncbi:PE-PGRS family protein PE_PGRS16-like [Diachasmimorpha longicaudata]|uniref:PE-PGRS family protein PE_PGRS16-like n=1 Tax=Diachasmimorpha longicaudata TaxID=58733 RepID=UPI0030B8BA2F
MAGKTALTHGGEPCAPRGGFGGGGSRIRWRWGGPDSQIFGKFWERGRTVWETFGGAAGGIVRESSRGVRGCWGGVAVIRETRGRAKSAGGGVVPRGGEVVPRGGEVVPRGGEVVPRGGGQNRRAETYLPGGSAEEGRGLGHGGVGRTSRDAREGEIGWWRGSSTWWRGGSTWWRAKSVGGGVFPRGGGGVGGDRLLRSVKDVDSTVLASSSSHALVVGTSRNGGGRRKRDATRGAGSEGERVDIPRERDGSRGGSGLMVEEEHSLSASTGPRSELPSSAGTGRPPPRDGAQRPELPSSVPRATAPSYP